MIFIRFNFEQMDNINLDVFVAFGAQFQLVYVQKRSKHIHSFTLTQWNQKEAKDSSSEMWRFKFF